MRKIINIGITVFAILAVFFFAACKEDGGGKPGTNPKPEPGDTTYTYDLNVDPISVLKSDEAQDAELKYALISTPAGGLTEDTAAIEFTGTGDNPGFTVKKDGAKWYVVIPAAAEDATYDYKLTLSKGSEKLAEKAFTITITDPGELDKYEYTVSVEPIMTLASKTEQRIQLTYSLTVDPSDGPMEGIIYSLTLLNDDPCDFEFDRDGDNWFIVIPANTPGQMENLKLTLTIGGIEIASCNFMVTLKDYKDFEYFMTVEDVNEWISAQAQEIDLDMLLEVTAGGPLETILEDIDIDFECSDHTSCALDFQFKNESWKLIIPANAKGTHQYTITVSIGGYTLDTDDFTVKIIDLADYTYTMGSISNLSSTHYQSEFSDFHHYIPPEVTVVPEDGPMNYTVEIVCVDDNVNCAVEFRMGEEHHGTVEEWCITFPANMPLGEHAYTLKLLINGTVIASDTFVIEVVALSSFEFGMVWVDDISFSRTGSDIEHRTIKFVLVDSMYEIVDVVELREKVEIVFTDKKGLTIEQIDGEWVVQDGKTLEPDKYILPITVYYDGRELDPDEFECNDEIEVNITRLLHNVKYFNGENEITAFRQSVEHDFAATAPADPSQPSLEFGGWYTTHTLTTPFDFDTIILEETDIFGKYEAPKTHYNLNVTISLSSNAPLEDGEHVWIAGNFFTTSTSQDWDKSTPPGVFLLTKQENDTWTGTISDIPIAKTTLNYNLYAVKSTSAMAWGTKVQQDDLVLNNATTGVLTYTVNQWIGRAAVVAGNLLKEPGFDEAATGSWAITNLTAWTWSGLKSTSFELYCSGNNPAPHSGAASFLDHQNWGTAASNSGLNNNATLTLTQTVAATGNGLQEGTRVILSAWINRVNTSQTNFRLVVGGQEEVVTSQLTTATGVWQQVSHTFTLTASDIVSGNITVGIKYTASSTTCRTALDDFYFGVAE